MDLNELHERMEDIRAEQRGEALLYALDRIKTSAPKKKKGLFSWLKSDEDEDDSEEPDDGLIDVPAPTAFDIEDDDEEEGNDSDVQIVAPGNFKFVRRDIGLTAPDGDVGEKELLTRWQRDKDPRDLEAIYSTNKDVLNSHIRTLSRMRLPKPAIEGLVYNAFHTAAKQWDPARGANLRTYYKQNQWRNLLRDVKPLAQFTKAERGRVSRTERTLQLREAFELERGHIPTSTELQGYSGGELKVKDINMILEESRGDLLGSRKLDADYDVDTERSVLHATRRARDYYNGRHQRILNHMFGLDDNEFIGSNNKLAAKFGVTPQYLSTLKRKFAADIQNEMQILGV